MDREFAKAMMRHSDALDLLLGAMSEIVREHAPDELKRPMAERIFHCVNELHVAIRNPITNAFPEYDRDYDK
jgi:hypothetical protein